MVKCKVTAGNTVKLGPNEYATAGQEIELDDAVAKTLLTGSNPGCIEVAEAVKAKLAPALVPSVTGRERVKPEK